jgi:hypothetical protein
MACIQRILMLTSNVSEVVERLTTHPKIDFFKAVLWYKPLNIL